MTTISDALTKIQRLFVDTSPLIYLIEQHPLYYTRAEAIFGRIESGDIYGFSSVIVLTEVLTMPLRTGDTMIEQEYRDVLLHSRNFSLLPIDVVIANRAAQLRAYYNLRTPDALQIAAAIAAGCEAFLTNDMKLKRVSELPVLILDDLELDPP